MFIGYIYKIIDIRNNKCYIGKRIITSKEYKEYWGSGIIIKRIIKKHGTKFFKKTILGYIETKDKKELKILLNEAEIVCIEFFQSVNRVYGYNIAKGGEGWDGKRSEETKQKMRKPKSEEHRKKLNKDKLGKPRSEEVKRKIVETRKRNGGYVLSVEQKEKAIKNIIEAGNKYRETVTETQKRLSSEKCWKTRKQNKTDKDTEETKKRKKESALKSYKLGRKTRKGTKKSLEEITKIKESMLKFRALQRYINEYY